MSDGRDVGNARTLCIESPMQGHLGNAEYIILRYISLIGHAGDSPSSRSAAVRDAIGLVEFSAICVPLCVRLTYKCGALTTRFAKRPSHTGVEIIVVTRRVLFSAIYRRDLRRSRWRSTGRCTYNCEMAREQADPEIYRQFMPISTNVD